VTLTALSKATGISKSTLSRLETGQGCASLELLLPLAQACRVPLDDLVGAAGRARALPARTVGKKASAERG
jgi:transcriptional regulator with XRE-family HTH domain